MKILASDFDNTLYVNDEKIVQKNISAIKKFITRGNIFCIITGQNYSSIKPILNHYKIPYSYLICEDGAKIFNNVDYCIDTTMINKDKVEQIIAIFEENNYNYYLDDGYNETLNTSDCVKIASKYQDRTKAEKILNEIKRKVEVYAYLSSEHINIMDISINKSNALTKIIKIENLPISKINVIGDDINDYEMLETFNGAIIKQHNKLLDTLNKQEYETLYEYIGELSKN